MQLVTERRTLQVLAVNVGTPTELTDERSGRTTMTGIVKHRVVASEVEVGTINIAGDRQADRTNHGGVDKAVYCYPHDHLPAWRQEYGYPPSGRDAPFGENLSLHGAAEDDIRIGDRWRWGDVVLEVAQPRWPCFKLGLHAGQSDFPVRLIKNERSGWYCRVVAEGMAPTTDARLELIRRDDTAPTIRQAFQAAKGVLSEDHALRLASAPELATSWRGMILARYRTSAQGS